MFDTKRLLDQFLGAGAGGDPMRRGGGGSDLGDLARQLGVGGGGRGGMGMGKGLAMGGLAGLLLGSKGGRKMGKKALRVGGMALLGGLAYKAYRDWQQGQDPQAKQEAYLEPPAGTPFRPQEPEEETRLGLTLIRAMISAAKADGHIDADEQTRIFAKMDAVDLDAEAKAFLMDELRGPLDVDGIARSVRTKEEAAEVYLASLLAIDPDTPAERGYLDMLAGRMGLEPELVRHLEATVEAAAEA